ncbi:Na+/H+ antiporter subunit D [Sporosarcina pasteurii]|uniref:Multiple resistance and pH homeostasis protein D n=1 Tax=Sporosarcina pasteurii TaxID=1474 RepID=A0A380C8D0_SPOPA|nr:Na+/H+ antiporter subunit D [Sporosarcina pasteurii]MDS9472790.1 Na+/H+ antiporter subunit D [Sporosarcina pasteurii]QBQ04441.1 Na+/H+ antiporter subunit D [Sporosarcina pasteurii]SUJ15054.1 Multiple resistance and pH homeostasis protein D [Sporosarcina pasteurii]
MINLLLLPIILPFFFAVILLFFKEKIVVQRIITIVGLVISLIASIILMATIKSDGIQTVTLGSWPAPFGISMVSDMLSALLVTTSIVITLFVVWYSFTSIGHERERFYYYPAVLLMLTGINGAFTTGDIFNMFVFFEVLLMASYVLIVLGGEKKQLRESIKYVLVNVVSSALFVVAVALLYAVIGTLNMADIAVKVAEVGQPGIITVIAILFLLVFGIKGAIFPLYFWLPGSYAAPPMPVLALFGALLTKVGVYAITRTYTLFFIHNMAVTHELLLILSILTIIAGCVGALAYFDLKHIMIYNIVIAVGVILFGVAQMNDNGMTGAMYYLMHDMIIKGALFLLIGIIIAITGTSNLRKMGGLMKTHAPLGWMYLVAAFGLAGIPPLSGFAGKLLIAKGAFEAGNAWGSMIMLASSLIVLLSVIRIFIYAFWGEPKLEQAEQSLSYRNLMTPAVLLVILSIAYGVGTEWLVPYMTDASDVLLNPSMYVDAVLKE